jgi:hypothetical protein
LLALSFSNLCLGLGLTLVLSLTLLLLGLSFIVLLHSGTRRGNISMQLVGRYDEVIGTLPERYGLDESSTAFSTDRSVQRFRSVRSTGGRLFGRRRFRIRRRVVRRCQEGGLRGTMETCR